MRPRIPWPLQRTPEFLAPRSVAIEGPGLIAARGLVAMRRPGDMVRSLAARAVGVLPARLSDMLRSRARLRTYGAVDAVLGRFVDPAAAGWCAARIAAIRPDAMLIDTIFRAPILADPRLRAIPSVLVAQDVFHLRHAGLAARGYRLYPATLDAAEEARWLALTQTVAAIQPEEAGVFRSMLPGKAVIVAGMPIAVKPPPAASMRDPDRLVFVGSASLPNVDGLRWFLAEIWPRLRECRPAVRLEVCGDVCDALTANADGVRLLGRVGDLAPVLHRAALAVAPLRAGSGLKIKLLDYLAHGVAVVTTPAGAAGLPPSAAVLPVEGAEAMAVLIAGLLRQDAQARAPAALALAGTYGAARVFAELGAALDERGHNG